MVSLLKLRCYVLLALYFILIFTLLALYIIFSFVLYIECLLPGKLQFIIKDPNRMSPVFPFP